MSPPAVALLTDWYHPRRGGIEHQVHGLARHLADSGARVEVFTPFPGPRELDGIAVHRLPLVRLPGAGIVIDPRAAAQIRERLRSGRFDVAHVQFGIVAPFAYVAALQAQALGIPTLCTFHSLPREWALPYRMLRSALGVPRWPARFIAVSGAVARAIAPLTHPHPVQVLGNGVDVGWWSAAASAAPAASAREDDGLHLVSALRLHPRKRPRLLLHAFAAAVGAGARRGARRGTHPTQGGTHPTRPSARLTIAGDGRELPTLRRLARRLGVERQVHFAGWMSRADLRALYATAHAFLLPSPLEAFGIAALEARAAGLPVIGRGDGGAADFLAHRRDALLPVGDDAFVRSVCDFMRDPGLRDMLTAGAAVPPRDHDWDDIVRRHLELYRDG